MFKYLGTLIVITTGSLFAQESEQLTVKILVGGSLGYDSVIGRKCFVPQKQQSEYDIYLKKKDVFKEYFKRISEGDGRGAAQLIKKDSDLRRIANNEGFFYFWWASSFYGTFREFEMKFCVPRVATYRDKVKIGRGDPINKMDFFYCTNETFEQLEKNNPFIKELKKIDDVRYSDLKMLEIPEMTYKIEAKYVGEIVPHLIRLFELRDITPIK